MNENNTAVNDFYILMFSSSLQTNASLASSRTFPTLVFPILNGDLNRDRCSLLLPGEDCSVAIVLFVVVVGCGLNLVGEDGTTSIVLRLT